MSSSSGSSSARSFSAAAQGRIRKLYDELESQGRLEIGGSQITPTGGQRGLMELSTGATILPSVGQAVPGDRTEIMRANPTFRPKQIRYEGPAREIAENLQKKVSRELATGKQSKMKT